MSQTSLTAGDFQSPGKLKTEHPNADRIISGHPVKERTPEHGAQYVCLRCGRWTTPENHVEFNAPCDPTADHAKHFSVRRRLLHDK